jgi:purine-binding chemotaxis protein CheW
VDKVSEVADIEGNQIEEVPALGAGEQGKYLSGIGKVKDQVKMILDVEQLLFDVPDEVLDGSTKAAGAVA